MSSVFGFHGHNTTLNHKLLLSYSPTILNPEVDRVHSMVQGFPQCLESSRMYF